MSEQNQWQDDVLNRKKYADFLTSLLKEKQDPFVLNLNAKWGEGKTFFIKKWIVDLNKHYPVVYFNAWENDFSHDPMLAIVSCFEEQLLQIPFLTRTDAVKKNIKEVVVTGGKLVKSAMPAILKGLVKKAIGEGADALFTTGTEDETTFSEITGKMAEEYLQLHKKTKETILIFKKQVANLLSKIKQIEGISLPLFIFIDELDRCKPLFAIELLEKLKHVFDIENVVFIVATDTKQLSHSIKAAYGQEFEAEIYLKRFFEIEYSLPDPSHEEFADLLVQKYKYVEDRFINFIPDSIIPSSRKISTVFSILSEYFQLSLRDQEQCFSRLDAIIKSSDRQSLHLFYLTYLLMLHHKHRDLFDEYFLDKGIHRILQKTKWVVRRNLNEIYGVMVKDLLLMPNTLIEIYSSYVFQDKRTLIDLIQKRQQDVHKEILISIADYLDLLKKYREKIQLVGALV